MIYIVFLIGLLVINLTLFFPNYLINYQGTSFFPDLTRLNRRKGKGLWVDTNLDPFRISIDISFLIILAFITKLEFLIFLIPIYYCFIQVFNLYHCSFRKIYGTHPAFVNDWKLLKTGIGFLYAESKVKFLAQVLLGIVLLIALSLSVNFYIAFLISFELNWPIIIASSFFLLAYLAKGYMQGFYNSVLDQEYRLAFFPLRVSYNLKLSLKMVRSTNNAETRFQRVESSDQLKLDHKPNIHFICIESYGSILLKNSELNPGYYSIYNQFCSDLSKLNYESTSNLSRSVSLVGPSWLAYTSLLLGSKVKSNYEYEYLLAHKPEEYSSLAKSLKQNGYKSFNLNPIKPRAGINVPYQKIKDLYGFDEFILFDDIPFTGTCYGVSETPPDQYVLNITREQVLSKLNQPYFLFYLTKNSHSPFISPHQTVEEWKSLNDGSGGLIGNEFLKIPSFMDYLKAIEYQLNSIYSYIHGFNNDKNDNIFILVGDHQPHHIVHSDDYGLDTPVHIISSNKNFIKSFEKYGFNNDIENLNSKINHEDLRSMFEFELMNSFEN